MQFKFDAKKVHDSNGFTPLPKGEYEVKLINSLFGFSTSNNPMVTLEFAVLNDPTDFKNRVIREYYVMTSEVAQNKLGVIFSLCNYNLDESINIQSEIENEKLVGATFIANIGQRTYNDKNGVEKIANTINNIKSLSNPF